MKRFIARSVGLAFLFAVAMACFSYFIGLNLSSKVYYGEAIEVKYAVIGHSHPECAFDDSLVMGMKNFALSGEAYFYNFYKVKSMLLKGVRFENVFIEYTNNSLSKDLCEWIWDDQNLSRSYVKFSPFITMSDKASIFLHNPKGWLNAFCLSMKWRMDQLNKSQVNYLDYAGGYKFLDKMVTDSLIHAAQMQRSKAPMETCELNQFYLRELIVLLREHGTKVFLIRCPVHTLYSGFDFEESYDSIFSHHFSDVERLDFAHFPLGNEAFADLEHLNHLGAKKFSSAFNDLLSQGLLSAPNKQYFIDQYLLKESARNVMKP